MEIVLTKIVLRSVSRKDITDAIAYAITSRSVVELRYLTNTVTINPAGIPFGGNLLYAVDYWVEKLLA